MSLALLSGAFSPLNAQGAPEVTVANPILKNVAQWDEYTGQFEAVRRVEIRPRVSGELVGIHFTDGQIVKAGDLLFTIDPRPFEIAVESAVPKSLAGKRKSLSPAATSSAPRS